MARLSQSQPTDNNIEFCTLGMLILDDIEFGDNRPSVKNVLGGAASFAVAGARIVAGEKHAQRVSWIVDVGSDFPPEILRTIKSWDTYCVIRHDRNRLTTRAWNGYGRNEERSWCHLDELNDMSSNESFRYLTPKLRMEPCMLSESQVLSKTIHMVCSPSRCMSIVQDILQLRGKLRRQGDLRSSSHFLKKPIFVWEPVPDLCTVEEQDNFLAAARVVDVVSPNELELGMIFGQRSWSEDTECGRELVKKILLSGIGSEGNGLLVIRAGKHGSYSYSRAQRIWLPAYHEPSCSEPTVVVDPTGAGNSFLGALSQGMVSYGRRPARVIDSVLGDSKSWKKLIESYEHKEYIPTALVLATVAAGFVIEQIGVPQISKSDSGKELWNKTEFSERVRLYTQRLLKTLEDPLQAHFLSS